MGVDHNSFPGDTAAGLGCWQGSRSEEVRFKSAAAFWDAVVEKFELKDQQKRANLRGNKVLPHCKKEFIVLHDGETLLECAGRLADWAGEDLVVVAVHEVSSL